MRERKNKTRGRFISWSVLAMTVVMLFGTMLSGCARKEDIVVLYTNDVHCGVDDNVGYAGVASYKDEMKEQTPYVTLVDAGDAIQGAPIGTLSKGEHIIDIMNEVGYDFAVPGNHEFDYGMDRFLELSKKLNCGYYSCNFFDLQTDYLTFAPYKMIEYGDTQVAYIGVATPESFTKSTPVYFQDDNGNYIYGFCEDTTGEKLYQQVQTTVNNAKADGADYVILVGHLGEEGVAKLWTSDSVLANTTGIDACIDGHSHESYDKYVDNKDGDPVLLTQSGTKLEQIGKITIKPDGTFTSEQVSEVEADDKTVQFIKAIQDEYAETLEVVIGHTDVALTVDNPNTGERAVRSGETNLGDLTADAFRYVLGADVGLSNGGGIRADVEEGDITYGDALNVFPFGNMGCLVSVKGQQIKDALEMGASCLPDESGGFLQVSGMTYTIDSTIPSSVILDEKGNFVRVDGDYRVKDIFVGEEPLDENKNYTVASHNYMLKSSGDGMSMFQGCEILLDETISDMELLSEYIRVNLNGNVGAEYENPAGAGRITMIEKHRN